MSANLRPDQFCKHCGYITAVHLHRWDCRAMLAAAPAQQPLTDEQRKSITAMWSRENRNYTASDIIDAVEAAHGIHPKGH